MQYATPEELTSLTGCEQQNAELVVELAASTIDAYVRHELNESQESVVLRPANCRTLWVVPAGWPLNVSAAVEDDVTLVEGEDFRVRADGSLRRLGDEGWGDEVEVTYTTGFEMGSAELMTAKRITLELAARAAANPQWLDSITIDGTSPSFMTREGQTSLPQLTLTELQRQDLRPLIWRRRLA